MESCGGREGRERRERGERRGAPERERQRKRRESTSSKRPSPLAAGARTFFQQPSHSKRGREQRRIRKSCCGATDEREQRFERESFEGVFSRTEFFLFSIFRAGSSSEPGISRFHFQLSLCIERHPDTLPLPLRGCGCPPRLQTCREPASRGPVGEMIAPTAAESVSRSGPGWKTRRLLLSSSLLRRTLRRPAIKRGVS